MMLDSKAETSISADRNMLVPWYLIAAFGYYHLDDPPITDGLFDKICRQLDEHWNSITHRHKAVINRNDVRAGSCLLEFTEFPTITRDATTLLLRSRA